MSWAGSASTQGRRTPGPTSRSASVKTSGPTTSTASAEVVPGCRWVIARRGCAIRILALLLLAGAARASDAVVVVDKDGTTLDLTGKTFSGAKAGETPDRFTGIGLIVQNCKDVVIVGGAFRGFRCAILVRNCENVTLEGIGVSGNFRQRLGSTPEREDGRDWLWPHNNDKQEWRKNYGAGICIENSRKCIVRRCVGRNQQNGILLDRCRGCSVYDNDMSFNSGWGLALWRSSNNVVAHNSFDWCVRGYSHGVYDRGQDSAGILVFEQCNENVFAYNSATHGGDGFFLYAGNETLKKTGRGGCNLNRVINNDFSHAVANAIEATFSRDNWFEGNRCDDSNYGVWAGYSYETTIIGNTFEGNSVAGVAIEHGEQNRIFANTFTNNPRGIWLWWDNDKDLLQSRFGRTHSCLSRGYWILENSFSTDRTAVFLQDTTHVVLSGNDYDDVAKPLDVRGNCAPVRSLSGRHPRVPEARGVAVPGKRKAFLPGSHPRGRRFIMVDEWGPLDPRKPEVYPRKVAGTDACRFQVVGTRPFRVEGLPAGFTVEKAGTGFRVVNRSDGLHRFAATVVIKKERFPISGTLLNATWEVEFRDWTKDPRTDGSTFDGEPARRETVRRLHYMWRHKGDRFATRATTRILLPAGRYEVATLSDDGVRVIIDGKKIQEDWTHHGPTEHKTAVELEDGVHTIVVEHFEITGYAVLRFDLRLLK